MCACDVTINSIYFSIIKFQSIANISLFDFIPHKPVKTTQKIVFNLKNLHELCTMYECRRKKKVKL